MRKQILVWTIVIGIFTLLAVVGFSMELYTNLFQNMKFKYSLILIAIVAIMSSMSTVDTSVEVVNIWCSSWSTPDSNGNQTRLCCTLTGTGSACDSETRNCGYCGPQ